MKKLLILLILSLSNPAVASDITYQFKNPSFSGVGAGAQWLTIENQEHSRQQAIQDKIDAALKAQALADQNSILNRFMNNLQSRIYSQLSQQLTQNLFSNGSNTGTFNLDGNTISYSNDGTTIDLKITDTNGNITDIQIPIGSFSF